MTFVALRSHHGLIANPDGDACTVSAAVSPFGRRVGGETQGAAAQRILNFLNGVQLPKQISL